MNISVVNYSINHTIKLSDQAYKCFNAKELAGFKAANFNWSGLLVINILLAIVILYSEQINNTFNTNNLIDLKLIATATLFILNVAILITNYLLI